jgi:hypothetical protein
MTAVTTIAAKVSIIPSIVITSIYLTWDFADRRVLKSRTLPSLTADLVADVT